MAPDPPDKSKTTSQQSYAAALQSNRSNTIQPGSSSGPSKVSIHKPEVFQNHPAAIFFDEEIEALVSELKWQLVGKFNKMPPWVEVKSYFQKLKLIGECKILWFNYKHIFIKLSNEIDYASLRRNPVVDFDKQHRMRVFKWDEDFSPEKESSVVPVWISFPNLKFHMYNKDALWNLASALGTPLQIDGPTANKSRPSTPRICIEYDCQHSPPEKIFVQYRRKASGLDYKGFWQEVSFEKMPKYCSHCSHLGHDFSDCRFNPNSSKINGGKTNEIEERLAKDKEKTALNELVQRNDSVNSGEPSGGFIPFQNSFSPIGEEVQENANESEKSILVKEIGPSGPSSEPEKTNTFEGELQHLDPSQDVVIAPNVISTPVPELNEVHSLPEDEMLNGGPFSAPSDVPVRVDPFSDGLISESNSLPSTSVDKGIVRIPIDSIEVVFEDISKEFVPTSPEADSRDHVLLSERIMSKLNKNAASFFPHTLPASFHPQMNSWLGEGFEVGGSVPLENEDGLSLDNTWSEGSAQSEYQPYEEDFEDDFTVHPPIRRNSDSNINEVQSFPRNFPRNFSSPVTRSRGLKLSKKKNKLRFG